MEQKAMTLINRVKRLVNMGHDKAPETEIIDAIEEGTEFHGAKLWILVIAVFVASLGLNTNSAAVIIGAMLISPLMGPIIGMGLGIGIYDFELFKRALRNYITTTLFSVATATVYFFISPLNEAQSELLARTSPTIYDVGIALFGGLAGIIALSSKSQRVGNVIPGVAIATALMPPLCTTGYGIALGNWTYAAGAFYLYLINTVFIALSTFTAVAFIIKMHKKKQVDRKKELHVRRIIIAIALLTIIPSIYLTLGIVRKTVYEQYARQFVQNEFNFTGTQVLSYSADVSKHTLRIVLLGETIDSTELQKAEEKLTWYHMEGTELKVVQGAGQLSAGEIRQLIESEQKQLTGNKTEKDKTIEQLQTELALTHQYDKLASVIYPEMRTLFPETKSLSILKAQHVYTADSVQRDSTRYSAIVGVNGKLSAESLQKMQDWLQKRTALEYLTVTLE